MNKKRLVTILLAVPILVIISFVVLSCVATRPSHLGVKNGQLAPCPETPNCVSSQSEHQQSKMAAITYKVSQKEILQQLKKIIEAMPRAKIITNNNNYLYAEFTSKLFRFVDDIEFYCNETKKTLHFRSASRIGHSDMGVNRKRITEILKKLKVE